jgi:hypothetical protein
MAYLWLTEALLCDLPKPLCTRRCELLPRVLQEWDRTTLREHLSRGSRAKIRERIKKLDSVTELARLLREALEKLDDVERSVIVLQMIKAEPSTEEVRREEYDYRMARLFLLSEYLAKLGGVHPREIWKPQRGQPPNITAYLVLQDAAAIFEWLMGMMATREVDRDDGSETGSFFRFASILWPIVFGKGTTGLPSAMKNWAQWRSQYNERSALIANIALRHPAWGIFKS